MKHVVLPVLIAAVLPFAMTLIAKAGRFSRRANRETRTWQGHLTGWRQRAHWAHQNAFETFPMFAAAVILAHLGAPGSETAVAAAWAYPATRIGYNAAYLADQGELRSLLWFAGLGCIVVLFVTALG